MGYDFLESVDSKFEKIRIYKSYKVLICGFLLPSNKTEWQKMAVNFSSELLGFDLFWGLDPFGPHPLENNTGQVLNKLANRWPSFKVLLKARKIFSKNGVRCDGSCWCGMGLMGKGLVAVVIYGLIFFS